MLWNHSFESHNCTMTIFTDYYKNDDQRNQKIISQKTVKSETVIQSSTAVMKQGFHENICTINNKSS
uniref:Uncharacterized protein n=1 Tax=Anguilla anguilla TaxID=7936 RepID=A0A0E9RFL4_ANGAN